METILTITKAIMGLAVTSNIFLGMLVFFRAPNRTANRLFGVFGIVSSLWVFGNFMMLITPGIFWLKSSFAFGTLVPAILWFFIMDLCEKKVPKIGVLLLSLLTAFFFFASYAGNLIVAGFQKISLLGYQGNNGPLFIWQNLFAAALMFSSVYFLIFTYLRAKETKKKQVQYVLLGFFIGTVIFFAINFGPFFIPSLAGTFQFAGIDSAVTLVLIFFTSFAVTRYRLFNIRVILTEIFVFIMGTTIVVLPFVVESVELKILTGVIFILFCIFGYFLIKSVYREVKINETLERKVRERTKEIRRAYEVEKRARKELESLDRSKEQFLLIAQHHLRTPLTKIMLGVNLVLDGTYGEQPKKTIELMKKFQTSITDSIKMANEFLDVAEFQSGKKILSLKPGIAVESIIEDVIEGMKFEAESKKIYLKFRKAGNIHTIMADKEKLKTALSNIINNAIKYTREGGVAIKIEDQNTKLRIAVQDTGIGISSKNLQTLFGATFERSEEAKKLFATGKGLGLYMAYQIIKAHNGKIWAESEGEDHGSVFYIEIPK